MPLGLSASANKRLDAGPVVVSLVLKLRMQDMRTRKGSFVLSPISVAIGFSNCFDCFFNSLIILSIFFGFGIFCYPPHLFHCLKKFVNVPAGIYFIEYLLDSAVFSYNECRPGYSHVFPAHEILFFVNPIFFANFFVCITQ